MKKWVKWMLVLFAVIAIAKEPAQSASLVKDAWDAIINGFTNFFRSFSTFVHRLGK